MILYFGLATILFLIAVCCSTKEMKTNTGVIGFGKIAIFSFLLITIILGGIRWKAGTDWENYYNFFIYNGTWKEFNSGIFEISYSFLNFLIKKYFDSYTVLLLIISFIVIFLRYRTIKLLALFPIMSYYLFFCDNIGGIFPVRQTIAISIAVTSIYFIHKKNMLAFILVTILAASFHLSLLIWFISYPLYHRKISSSNIIILFITATVIGMIGSNLIIWIVEKSLINGNISGSIASRIKIYILGKYSDSSLSMLRMIFSFIKRMVFVALFIILRPKLIQRYSYANGLINIYLFSNVIFSLFAFNEAFAPMARMVTPFLFIEVLLLPVIISLYKDAHIKYIIFLLLYIYGLVKLNSAISAYPELYTPYRSILD